MTDDALSDIPIGKRITFEKTVTAADVESFAELTGDFDPLHLDE